MVDLLLDAGALLGESPRWHADEARLYWVDIDACRIHRTDPASGHDEVMQLDGPVGCVAPRRGGGLIAAQCPIRRSVRIRRGVQPRRAHLLPRRHPDAPD